MPGVNALILTSILAETSFNGPGLIVGMIIGGAVGAAIGNAKGRLGLGVVLGALLGCIGWIIVAVLPSKK